MKLEIQHVAVECSSEEVADRFFGDILGSSRVRQMILSSELSSAIFGLSGDVLMILYENGAARFEVFITPDRKLKSYGHICVVVEDTKEFVERCRQHGLQPFFVQKDGKQLLFVRDFSENLYEIK